MVIGGNLETITRETPNWADVEYILRIFFVSERLSPLDAYEL